MVFFISSETQTETKLNAIEESLSMKHDTHVDARFSIYSYVSSSAHNKSTRVCEYLLSLATFIDIIFSC